MGQHHSHPGRKRGKDDHEEHLPASEGEEIQSSEPTKESTPPPQKKPGLRRMDKLRRSLSIRKKKAKVPEASKPHQWHEDEKKVRDGTCSFQVRYLGCLEVYESRGMQVCEEAIKTLKSQCKGKYQRAVLYVSGDALRVVDEISKGLIVDQTIEKVSFCAPDRNNEKGFAYICRDGATRRWMCHAFMTVKESGERLSHAVGCAFAICLERKQKRERETGVSVHYSEDKTSFTRFGSFRQATLTERREDPQSAILAEPAGGASNGDASYTPDNSQMPGRERPRASQDMIMRQGSFRHFSKLNEQSPFKKQLSLQVVQLPSNIERLRANYNPEPGSDVPIYEGDVIEEASPTTESADSGPQQDSIALMCQQLTQGLSSLTSDVQAKPGSSMHAVNASPTALTTPPATATSVFAPQIPSVMPQTPPVVPQTPPVVPQTPPVASQTSTTASQRVPIRPNDPFNPVAPPVPQRTDLNGSDQNNMAANPWNSPVLQPVPATGGVSLNHPAVPTQSPITAGIHSTNVLQRGISLETGTQAHRAPTLSELAKKQQSFQISTWAGQPYADPFDPAWATKAASHQPASSPAANPFETAPFK